jgi:hypothetical protein
MDIAFDVDDDYDVKLNRANVISCSFLSSDENFECYSMGGTGRFTQRLCMVAFKTSLLG